MCTRISKRIELDVVRVVLWISYARAHGGWLGCVRLESRLPRPTSRFKRGTKSLLALTSRPATENGSEGMGFGNAEL